MREEAAIDQHKLARVRGQDEVDPKITFRLNVSTQAGATAVIKPVSLELASTANPAIEPASNLLADSARGGSVEPQRSLSSARIRRDRRSTSQAAAPKAASRDAGQPRPLTSSERVPDSGASRQLRLPSVSQDRLALKAEVDRSYVGGLERQEENATVDLLNRLTGAHSVPLAKLFNEPAPGAPSPEPLRLTTQTASDPIYLTSGLNT